MLPDYLMKKMREDIASSIIKVLKRDLDFEFELKLEGLIGIFNDNNPTIFADFLNPFLSTCLSQLQTKDLTLTCKAIFLKCCRPFIVQILFYN